MYSKNNESVHAFCRRIGDRIVRRLEKLLGINEGALDAGVPTARFAEVPILDNALIHGSDIKTIIKHATRKVLLEEECAVIILNY